MKLGPLLLLDGYLALGPEATVEAIEPEAEKLFLMQANINWWIGDLITFGEARFGDDIWQVVPIGVSPGYIDRAVAHSQKIKASDRVPGVSWTIHSMVMKFEPKVRRALLQKAASEQMDTSQFSEFLKRTVK
jgi:hypothetical protein